MEITYTAKGLDNVLDTLSDWTQQIQDGEPLQDISRILTESTINNYAMQTDYRKWPKRKKEYAWPLLIKTGTKRQTELSSIVAPWQKMPDGFVKNISSTDYGAFHQDGTSKLPIRKSVYLQQRVKDSINRALHAIFRKK